MRRMALRGTMTRRLRSSVVLATTLALGVGLAAVVTTQANAATGCRVDYTVNQWSGGFTANVAITNLGDALNGWRLQWSFANGQTVTQGWNGVFSQSGSQVTVTNESYNAALGTNATVTPGFNGTWTGTNTIPTAFTLNGVACTGSTQPGTTPTAGTTTTPSTTPTAGGTATAWRNGSFTVDTPGVTRRSNIVLKRANTNASEFVPLGNGTLGAAVWAANGFTAQLNRTDTFPNRWSPGWVVIPGLSRLTSAADFSGYFDVYDGTLHQSGGGMTLTAYIRADTAQLVVDVTGADPASTQTARVQLWSSRNPTATASGSVATLSQTWTDNTATGASGRTFGAMAGISAGGRNVTASTPDSRTAQVSFQPNSNGSYRVITVAPTWTGGDPIATTRTLLGTDLTRSAADLAAGHLTWWHNYWNSVGLIKISSADGSGEYFENMRTLYLYNIAAHNRGTLPGTQAGVADLFTFNQDSQPWFPAGYWFWNIRMMVQANLSAGAFALNDPVFTLYRTNVSNIAAWTSAHFAGREGLCVPEIIRFNGNGYYGGSSALTSASCESTIAPNYTARTVTTGAEVSLWIWQTYLTTDDRSFLSAHYPIMSGAAKFLLSHATTGSDGLLHTFSNAHEHQWDVTDPITDVAAMQALFPVVVSAAQTLGVDAELVTRLNAAIPKIRPLPRTDTATKSQVLTPASDAAGNNMLAMSAQPTAATHNQENVELEPVWPYNLIGDSGSQSDLAKRTFTRRGNVTGSTWSYDSLHAARLGRGDDMRTAMIAQIGKYQIYPSGLASWNAQPTAPYLEEQGVIAAALSEGLVQNYDGTLRIAPGWPQGWDADGTVYIQHKGKAHVQIRNGNLITVAVNAGATGNLTVRNPWPGQNVTVIDSTGATVTTTQTTGTFTIAAQAGRSYLIQRTSAPTTSLPFTAVSGTPATTPKTLNGRSIGLTN
jgi:hypothetical protein